VAGLHGLGCLRGAGLRGGGDLRDGYPSGGRGAGDPGLQVEEEPLVLRVAAVLAERAVGADDPVRGHDDRDRRASAGRSGRAVRSGRARHDRDLAV